MSPGSSMEHPTGAKPVQVGGGVLLGYFSNPPLPTPTNLGLLKSLSQAPAAGNPGLTEKPRARRGWGELVPDSGLQATQLEPGLLRYAELLQGVLCG